MKGTFVNKSELIDAIAKHADISKAAAGRALDATVDAIRGSLKKGDIVTLVGFGSFYVGKRARAPAAIRAPTSRSRSGAAKVPKFRAGKALEGCAKLALFRPATAAAARQGSGARSRTRVLSSVGRASPLQGECREFEPLSTHHVSAAARRASTSGAAGSRSGSSVG